MIAQKSMQRFPSGCCVNGVTQLPELLNELLKVLRRNFFLEPLAPAAGRLCSRFILGECKEYRKELFCRAVSEHSGSNALQAT